MRTAAMFAAIAALIALVAGCDPDGRQSTPFIVISCSPSDLQTNVSQSAVINVRTTNPIDPRTVIGTSQVILADQQNSLVPVSITFHGEVMTITPGTPLASNGTYGVALRPGVRDIYGANIETPYAFTFSTGPALASIPNWPPFTLTTPVPPVPLGPPGTFTAISPLWVPRARHTATKLIDGRVLIAGGETAVGFTRVLHSVELFDTNTLQWTMSTSNNGVGMLYPRAGHTATLLNNGKMFVAGGTNNGLQALDTGEIYDPKTDNFSAVIGQMSVGRMFHSASLMGNGNVILSGGATSAITNNGFMSTPLTDTIEIYDTNSGTFQMCATSLTQGFFLNNPGASSSIIIGLVYHSSDSLPDGTILIAGGLSYITAPFTVADGIIYAPDPTGVGINGSIRTTGNTMKNPRWGHCTTIMPEGDPAGLLIVTGGATTGVAHMSCEVFDYTMVSSTNGRKGVFSYLASNMSIARRSHTATYIPSAAYAGRVGDDWGKILVAGGSQRVGQAGQTAPYPPHRWPFLEVVGCGGCAATDFADIFDPFKFGKSPNQPFRGIEQTGQFIRTQDAQGNLTVIPQTAYLGRYWHTATGLPNGTVLIAGGYDCVGCMMGPAEGQILGTCSIYNP